MKALVTGATGFVGRHLVESLCRGRSQVTVLARSPEKAAALAELGVRIVYGDLEDSAALAAATAGQEVIFHVAGLVAARTEAELERVNATGTRRLLGHARSTGRPRAVYVSSIAAAGPSRPGEPLSSGEEAGPVSAYGRSKLSGELATRQSGLPWTIVRPPLVYGPHDREVLKLFRLARRGLAPLFGDGRQQLSVVFAPDLAEALQAVATAEETLGRIYYPCHPEVCSSEQFARRIGRAVGRPVRVVRLPASLARLLLTVLGGLAGAVGRTTVLNRDKANELLQPAWTGDPLPLERDSRWRAEHDLASGLERTAAWYREQGWI